MATDFQAAANALLRARRTRVPLDALPAAARPTSIDDVQAIQELVAAELGPIVAWKVGAATPSAEPGGAPIHAATLRHGSEPFRATDFNLIGVEGEIGFTLGSDLPSRDTPYTREEILEALATMHPMIELVDSRFRAIGSDKLSHAADQGSHGALVVGPALADWRHIDPIAMPVRLTLNGKVALEKIGGNSAGEPIRLIQWLANTGSRPYGGLKAGMVITTGSCTGMPMVEPGVRVRVEFEGVGAVETAVL
ncbi:2-keto-4-pentenoate hydratase [Pseudoroseomonas globiformis]|uniref:2-keto-4-pentenoate hydratase n=1 Tax=Teichococcus globiformis TaxID=2307229 RepID=A0ABV7G4B7_9PROT